MGMRLLGRVFLLGGQDFNMVYLDWPANDANTYLIDTGETLVMVDCGCGESLPGILENLEEMEFDFRDLSHVLLTHAHLPHAGAAEDLRRNGVEVVAGPRAARAVREGGLPTAAYHYHRRFVRVEQVTQIPPGDRLTVGNLPIEAVALPGHSPDSMGYRITQGRRRMLFCGDAVRHPALEQFRDRPGYDPDAYFATLAALLEDPPDVLYPGHGPFCLSKAEHWIAEELKKLMRAEPRPRSAEERDDG